jgi:hypothetical protein
LFNWATSNRSHTVQAPGILIAVELVVAAVAIAAVVVVLVVAACDTRFGVDSILIHSPRNCSMKLATAWQDTSPTVFITCMFSVLDGLRQK